MQVSIFAAFVAGLISFLSPCVLPLVPGYISMLSGIGVEQLRQGERPRGVPADPDLRVRPQLRARQVELDATSAAPPPTSVPS